MNGSPWETDPTLRRDLKWSAIAFVVVLVIGFVLMLGFRLFEAAGVFLVLGAGVVGITGGLRIGKALNPDAPRSLRIVTVVFCGALVLAGAIYMVVRLD